MDICAFCANWRSESENLLEGVNFYSYFPHLLSNLGEIRYKWSVKNVGGWVRVQWKPVQGRLHLSYERKWNATEACVVNPTIFESKEHLGKLCGLLKGIHLYSLCNCVNQMTLEEVNFFSSSRIFWVTHIKFNVHGSVHRNNILVYKSQQDAQVTEFIFIWELLYMFRVSLSPIFRSTKQL
jgi:hypothetical protein